MTKPLWKQREDDRLLAKFATDAKVGRDGVVRWNSNDQVPPQDVLDLWAGHGKIFDMTASQAAREADTTAFLAEYRRNMQNLSPEQEAEMRAEARAAHGPGVKVVNVFTGRKFTT